jgi:thioredoxin reductase/Pyruvate/2-oxoacid:ferredoxin oxidoreductase delta subunit
MDLISVAVAGGAVAIGGAVAVGQVVRRQLRQRRDAALLEERRARNAHLARSLHPVIDTDVCIGSLSCLKACPEGDILGIVAGAARLVQADHCIGHGRCAAECPVDAIKLVMGSSERGVDLPEVDEYFESSKAGIHVVGELGGMGLIRNAITQGLQAARRLDAVLPRGPAPAATGRAGAVVDVAVVGAGPAGLATAFALKEAGRTFRLLEQGTTGGSMFHYPRQKVVMTEPVRLPIYGKIGRRVISKEELLAAWGEAIEKGDLRIEEGVKVEGVEGEDGRFVVHTSRGQVLARKVVLAIGRRGTPRKLGVPGEELEKVTYNLVDPEQYQGKRVLVVGGGDSALEAAIQIAETDRAEVALSYRGEELSRAREANRRKVGDLATEGRLQLLLPSEVKAIREEEVELAWGGRPLRLPNDFVIVSVGGELPVEFLKKAGVEMRRYHGERLGARAGDEAHDLEDEERERARLRRTPRLYAMLGAAIVAYLAWKGWDYYALGPLARLRSPLHKELRPAGLWGHSVGIVATLFMLGNFLYPLRKRWRAMKGMWSIRDWLNFHVFVGFMSPLVIAFHAAFRSNNVLATSTASALGVVVATGVVGRFIYGVVPSAGGKEEELEIIAGRFERLRSRVEPLLEGTRQRAKLEKLMSLATADIPRTSLLGGLLRLPFGRLATRLRVWRVRRLFPDRARYLHFRDSVMRLRTLRFQVAFYGALRRLLRGWRVFHASLAVFLVVAIAVHIAVSLYLGYGIL